MLSNIQSTQCFAHIGVDIFQPYFMVDKKLINKTTMLASFQGFLSTLFSLIVGPIHVFMYIERQNILLWHIFLDGSRHSLFLAVSYSSCIIFSWTLPPSYPTSPPPLFFSSIPMICSGSPCLRSLKENKKDYLRQKE